ncbi:MAG: ATP-binding cassette domain-containing protein [Gemmatimonadetes bacterium]|nr:ATP-binding cassette domain-containing protein [Gemmatimonadota bacterium]
MHPALEFSHVTRHWRAGILGSAAGSIALDDCSLAVAPGEIVIVTGGAGAGKSTLLLLASGRTPASAGTIRWNGSASPDEARPQLIGARPWEYNFLTVRQALAFHADQLALADASLPAPARFVPLMATVGLRGLSRVRLGQLGALDRLRVVVAQALLASPRLLCCEEPFAFCGPDERLAATSLMRSIAGRGTAVIIATREAAALGALGLGDRTLRLERGRIAAGASATRSVLELAVPSPDDAMTRLSKRLPSLARRGRRLRVPLTGQTPEAILALCRDAGVRVRGSRVAEEALPGAAASP